LKKLFSVEMKGAMLTVLINIFISNLNAQSSREVCEGRYLDKIECSSLECCVYSDSAGECLSMVGDSTCYKKQSSWYNADIEALLIVLGMSVVFCVFSICFIWASKNVSRTVILPRPYQWFTSTKTVEETCSKIVNRTSNCVLNNHNSKNGRILRRVCCSANKPRLTDLVTKGNIQSQAYSNLKGSSSWSASKMGVELSTGFIQDAHVISWDNIQDMVLCGTGTFGKIYRATYDYMEVAVKVTGVPWDWLSDNQRQDFMLEIRTAIQVSHHKNVLRVYGYTLEPVVSIITEFCELGSVLDCIDKGYDLDIPQKLDICIDAARGILSLHDKNVLHRDIACRNILLDRHMTARIADFGMCRVIDPLMMGLIGQEAVHQTYTKVGPLKWMSPESLMEQKSSTKSDVYSFAVTIWEIFVEEEPYGADQPHLAAAAVIHQGSRPNLSKLPAGIREAITPLLEACWREFPEERLSMKEVLMQLSGIKDNYVPLQQEMSLIATTITSQSATMRPIPSMVHAVPPEKEIAEHKDLSNNYHQATSTGEKIRRHLSRTRCVRDDLLPNKPPQTHPSQYLFHGSSESNSDNLQCPTHRKYLIANSNHTPSKVVTSNILKKEKVTQLNNSTFQSKSAQRDTLIDPLSPGYENQYSGIIPSKNYFLTSASELGSVTTYSTPTRLPTIWNMAKPAGLRSTYSLILIDSDSTTDATTENDQENGSTATIQIDEKADRSSDFFPKLTVGDESLSFLSHAVNLDDLMTIKMNPRVLPLK